MEAPNPSAEITSDDKLWSLLVWLFPILILYTLLSEDKKQRPFIKYNSTLVLGWAIVFAIAYVTVIGTCLSPVQIVMSIIYGIKAYNGEYVQVPWLTDFMKKQGWLS